MGPGRRNTPLVELKTHRLEPGEKLIDTWVASVPTKSGRFAKTGGTLVLTDRRLLFEPLALFGEYARAVALGDVARVEPLIGKSPRLTVLGHDGSALDFIVVAGRMSMVWSRKNKPVRDRAVARINEEIAARRRAR